MSFKVLLIYPNQRGMNMLPPAIGLLSSILKENGNTVEYSDSTPGDQFGIYGDATKIEKEMGWKYQTDLDEGLKRMIKLTNYKKYR